MMPPALIFNCHYNGLSIIQELGRHDVPVYALDTFRSVGTASRYAQYWPCPDPLCDEEAFIHFLIERGCDFDHKPVLFPTNDQWAAAIAKHKSELERWYIPCVADGSVVDLLISKDRFYRWAMKRGYLVPRLYSFEEVLNADGNIFPLIAKPIARRSSNLCADHPDICRLLDSHRMTVIHDTSEFHQFITRHASYLDYFLFQEYIPGMADRMYTVGIYANRQHEVLGLFTGRKVRGYPPDIGNCVVGQGERVPDEIIVCVKEMVRDLGYTGIAEFEFKKDLSTGKFWLIEINPRSWSWIGITPACGVSLPWIAYADLTGAEAIQYTESPIEDGEVVYLKVLEDFSNCMYLYRKNGYPDYHRGISLWLKDLKGKKRIFAEFSKDDPSVALYVLSSLGKSYLLSTIRSAMKSE
ncbi:carboxylate--amine ligase [Methanoculleus taiwanensis]|uniref:carboxylate--amine ligase n=1 Tax=Methanoculleus taiwanensis TaxID=1550565 RepID=UPI000FFE9D77|nr:ATP-grasp domain-containing protein [Methanoculleus taiwanensis]